MRKRAIGQIIACSIIAVILSTILLTALGCNAAGLIDEQLPGISAQKIVDAVQSTVESLPVPNISFFGLPIVFDNDATSGYAVGNGSYDETVSALEIDWASGRVVLVASESAEDVTVTEFSGDVDPFTAVPGGIEETYQMRHKLSGTTLRIAAFKSDVRTVFSGNLKKTLLVTLPKSALSKVQIDAASVRLVLTDLEASELDLDFASGSIEATGCAFDRADLDFASVSGTFADCAIDRINLDSANGSVTFDLRKAPGKLDTDMASGSLQLLLPADASFRVDSDTISGKVCVEGFENMTVENGKTVVNGGDSKFDFDIMSGKVTIEPRTGNTF